MVTSKRQGSGANASNRELGDRAVKVLSDAPAGLPDVAVADAVFGASSGAAWGPMLAVMLAGDYRIVRRDGHWHLTDVAGPPSRSPATDSPIVESSVSDLGGSVLALALATSGADPMRHHIRRISLVALRHGEVVARFDAQICIDDSGAGYGRFGEQVSQDAFEDALEFDEAITQLRTLTDGHTVYVYGARRADAFIKAQRRRANLPPFSLELVEADDLLRAHLPAGRKPGLVAAARELGVAYRRPGDPLADADALARVIERLRQRQAASPARTPEPAAKSDCNDAMGGSLTVRPMLFTREWLLGVPDGPGIYVFEDASGRVLYIGKARSLYRRLGDYVRQQLGANRQLEALAVRAVSCRTISTPSDLEATLLEARLIPLHQPEFNVAREARPPLTVIRAGPDEASPRLQLVAEVASDGARYFGPCESNKSARAALETVRAVYPAAFARKRGDVAVQREAVLHACRLLAGQKSPALALLREQMQAAAVRGDQAEVDRLRAALKSVQALDIRPSLLAGLPDGAQLLVLEHVFEGVTRTHLIQDGRRLVSVGWDIDYLPTDADDLRELAASMLAAAEDTVGPDPNADPDDLDEDVSVQTEPLDPFEPALVMRWLVQAWSRVEIARVPAD